MKSKRVATALAFVALNMAHSVMVAMAADPPAHEYAADSNHRIKGGSNNPYPMKTNLRVGFNSHRGLSKSSKSSKSAKTPSLSSSSKSSKSCKSSGSNGNISDEEVIEFVEDVQQANDIQPIIQEFTEALNCVSSCYTGTAADVIAECATSVAASCCEGDNACEWVGSATICDGACVGNSSCYNIPSNAVVMEDSCVGTSACQNMGNNSTALSNDSDYVPLFVARGSCAVDEDYTGDPVCESMGSSAESVVVGSKSCTSNGTDDGDQGGSCQSLGQLTEGSIFVGSESCDGPSACAGVAGAALVADIKIGSGSCGGGASTCAVIASTSIVLESVDIADGSCIGEIACGGMGFNDFSLSVLTTIAVGIGSCLGAVACCILGAASETISIGNGSCDRDNSCLAVGTIANTVAVGDGSCTGTASKCAFFGSEVEGADVTVNSGVCSSNAEECDGEDDPACTGDDCTGSFTMVAGGVCGTDLCTP